MMRSAREAMLLSQEDTMSQRDILWVAEILNCISVP